MKKNHDDDNVIYLDESMLKSDLYMKPPKKPSHGGKIFVAFAAGVVTALMITVLFNLFSFEEKPETEVDKVVPASAVEIKEIVQPLEEKKVPEKTEKKEEKKPEVKNPPVKKPSVKKVDKPKAKPKPPVVLSDKEQYELYYAFVSKKSEIPLPVSLHGAEKVIITLKNEWGKPLGAIADADLAKCMDKKNKQVTVFAVKEDENYLIVADKANSNRMTTVLNDKSLNISDGNNFEESRYPDRFNLKSIVIEKDGQKISLPLEFRDEFAKYVPRGKFNDRLKYEPSPEEKFFKEQFNEIKARDDYSSKLEDWNRKVRDIDKLVKKIAALKKDKNSKAVKFDEFTQKYKDYIEMLDKRDFKGAKKAFLTFLSLCDKVSNEDMEKFIRKYGKGQTNFNDFIIEFHRDLDSLIRVGGPKDLGSVPYRKVQIVIAARGKIVKGATVGEVEEELKRLKTKLAKDGHDFLGIRKEDFAAVKMDKELTAADFAKLLNKNIGYYAKREVKHGKNK